MTLQEELEAAENAVAQVRAKMRAASCMEVGHRWVCLGGCNAGCSDHCSCSVPVHECSVCKDCDYGDNPEGDHIREKCKQESREAGNE